MRDAFKIFENVIVPEAKDAIALAFKEFCSSLITDALGMLSAIRLDDQTRLLANKVSDEGPNWLLPSKFCSIELRVPEDRPQLALCIGQITAETLGFLERGLIVTSHPLTLPPLRGSLPLPQGERGFGAACRPY